eukprot:7733528-Ditylum_brightwellii.AAC.1
MILTINSDASYLSETNARSRAAGHPPPSSAQGDRTSSASHPLITDNNTAHGLTTGGMIPKRSNAKDMHFHLLQCREAQKQFNIKWKQGERNRADYHSKHYLPIHHQQQQAQYVVNATVAAESKDVVENTLNVMCCMCTVVHNQ